MAIIHIPARTHDRPVWPFGVNRNSWEAQGLVFWAPLGTAPVIDLIGNNRLGGRGAGNISGTTPMGRPQASMGVYGPTYSMNQTCASFTNRMPVNLTGGHAITMTCWAIFYRAPSASRAYTLVDMANSAVGIDTRFDTVNSATSPLRATHNAKVRVANEGVLSDIPYFLAWTDNDDPVSSAAMHIYRNGIECGYASSTDGTTGGNTLGEITLGGIRNVTGQLIFGAMLDCRIYNYQMSPFQIQLLYEDTPKWHLYWKPQPWLSVTSAPATSFVPRLSVLGAG